MADLKAAKTVALLVACLECRLVAKKAVLTAGHLEKMSVACWAGSMADYLAE